MSLIIKILFADRIPQLKVPLFCQDVKEVKFDCDVEWDYNEEQHSKKETVYINCKSAVATTSSQLIDVR